METANGGQQIEWLSAVETAKLVRVTLAKNFPGIKFSVKSHSYSGGSSIRVRWTDGPSSRQVDATVRHFTGKSFDGMTDSTSYHNTTLDDGRVVRIASWAPDCYREITNEEPLRVAALTMLRERCRLDETGTRFGNEWIENIATNMVHACDLREANPLERAFRVVVMRESN